MSICVTILRNKRLSRLIKRVLKPSSVISSVILSFLAFICGVNIIRISFVISNVIGIIVNFMNIFITLVSDILSDFCDLSGLNNNDYSGDSKNYNNSNNLNNMNNINLNIPKINKNLIRYSKEESFFSLEINNKNILFVYIVSSIILFIVGLYVHKLIDTFIKHKRFKRFNSRPNPRVNRRIRISI